MWGPLLLGRGNVQPSAEVGASSGKAEHEGKVNDHTVTALPSPAAGIRVDWQGQGQPGQECSSRAQGPSDEHQAPAPTPACSRARSGKFLLSASSLSPGLVQSTFSSFANLLLRSHATVVVQVLPSLPGEPHQAPKWFPSP